MNAFAPCLLKTPPAAKSLRRWQAFAAVILELVAAPPLVGMALSGHLTGAVYGRYAIVDEGMLKESEAKLAKLHAGEDRKYALTPAQIERLAKAVSENRPSAGQVGATAGK